MRSALHKAKAKKANADEYVRRAPDKTPIPPAAIVFFYKFFFNSMSF